MTQPPAIAFALGDRSAETVDAVAAELLRWSDQPDGRPLPLHRLFGLRNHRAARRLLRDALVVEAAALLDGSRWAKCKELAAMAAAMNKRRFRTWLQFGIPEAATEPERLLFRARHHEPLPESAEAYLSILPAAG